MYKWTWFARRSPPPLPTRGPSCEGPFSPQNHGSWSYALSCGHGPRRKRIWLASGGAGGPPVRHVFICFTLEEHHAHEEVWGAAGKVRPAVPQPSALRHDPQQPVFDGCPDRISRFRKHLVRNPEEFHQRMLLLGTKALPAFFKEAR